MTLHKLFYERYGGRLCLSRGCAPDRREEFVGRFLPGVELQALPAYMRHTAGGISA